ncbi:MAG: shikimate dehydrogenase [Alphaproteobacteria bacterium]|nr:shikimate dehydrogenase [Alphaproteobacteria bacterium]
MADLLSGKATVAGVFGWPVGHSLSPKLHGYWLKKYNVDGIYVPFPVNPDDFEQALRALPALGIAGCNVTVPHKVGACRLVDEMSDAAKIIGAVNTVFVRDGGSLYGDNTDCFGFMENLRHGCPDWKPSDGAGKAIVFGAGGAARAVCYGLLDAGAKEVVLINRTKEKAEKIANDLKSVGKISVYDWNDRSELLTDANLLVNTTTLGMVGAPELDVSLEKLSTDAVVTDIVYAPLETRLLMQAKANGNMVVDGLGMLLHQARPGFKGWFGVMPDVTDDLRNLILG